MNEKYDCLKLDNQICFPLYACAKEIVRQYKPYLDELDLTYTQYITMLVIWEHRKMNVSEMGEKLFLDSGTLTPVLKKLENKGWVKREKDKHDERVLNVTLTRSGEKLEQQAAQIPKQMAGCVDLDSNDIKELYRMLYAILDKIRK